MDENNAGSTSTKNNKSKTKRGNHFAIGVLSKYLDKMTDGDFRNYQKINLALSIIIAIVAIVVNTPTVLFGINSIVVSVGNIIIATTSTRNTIQYPDFPQGNTITIIICLVALILEAIFCVNFCAKAKVINSKQS